MPVMETIRKGTDSTIMKIVFGMIVLVFVFWGVGTANGPTSQTVAEVNGVRITDTHLQRAVRDATRNNSTSLDEDELKRLQAEALDALIQKEVMLQEAKRLGLEVSDDEVIRFVLQYDAFKDNDGKFNKKLYERTLKRMGMTRGKFEDMTREDLLLSKLMSVAGTSVVATEAQLRARFAQDRTTIELSYVRIGDELLRDDVVVDAAQVEAMVAAEDPRVRARYDADFESRYNHPRKADFSAILLRTDLPTGEGELKDPAVLEARLQAIAAEAAAGADFAQLARRHSEDLSAATGGNMGLLPEPKLDPALATAIFEAGAGNLTGVITTGRGLQLVKVHSVEDARVTPFDEVKADIAKGILVDETVGRQASEYAESVLTAWKASGTPPTELLAEQGLSVESTGPFSPTASQIPGIGINPGVSAALVPVKGVEVLDGVFGVPGGRVVAAVSSFTAADDAAFDEQKELVRGTLERELRQAFVEAWMDDLVAQARVKRLLQL